jgi:hypothetical protein
MNQRHSDTLEQQPTEIRLPEISHPPAIASIDQHVRGANDADVDAPARLKCVDVLALVMLDSCLGG